MLKSILSKEKGMVVVTGVASNQDEFLSFFNTLYLLECNPEVLEQRLVQRQFEGGNSFGKAEEEREYVKEMFKVFNQKLKTQGAIIIDATQAPEVIVNNILESI